MFNQIVKGYDSYQEFYLHFIIRQQDLSSEATYRTKSSSIFYKYQLRNIWVIMLAAATKTIGMHSNIYELEIKNNLSNMLIDKFVTLRKQRIAEQTLKKQAQ